MWWYTLYMDDRRCFTSLSATKQYAYEIGRYIQTNNTDPFILGLSGPLGSGKTTFVQFLAQFFGVQEVLQSPTFVFVREYAIPPPSTEHSHSLFSSFVHIDAYRCENEHDVSTTGIYDFVKQKGFLVCIEWIDRIPHIKPTLLLHCDCEGGTYCFSNI